MPQPRLGAPGASLIREDPHQILGQPMDRPEVGRQHGPGAQQQGGGTRSGCRGRVGAAGISNLSSDEIWKHNNKPSAYIQIDNTAGSYQHIATNTLLP